MYIDKLPTKLPKDYILIKPLSKDGEEVKTKSGIIMAPSEVPSHLKKGEVILTGNGKDGFCNVGDIVVYNKNTCTEIKVDGEPYLHMREDAGILMIL